MKKYAFWENDLFPYILGGPVTKIKDGMVETQKGFWFAPVFICDAKEGKQIKKDLEQIEEDYHRMMDSTRELFKLRLKNEFPAKLTEHIKS